MSKEESYPSHYELDGEMHLPHEAWHVIQQKHGRHFDSDGNPNPDAERHLPHEAWHVVQQRQGRVRPITDWEKP